MNLNQIILAYSEEKKEVVEKYIAKVFRENPDDIFLKQIYNKYKETREYSVINWYDYHIYRYN